MIGLRRVWLGLALVALALISALIVAPARWILLAIPVDAPLSVVAARGTLWAGSANVIIGSASHRRMLPDPLAWEVTWLPVPRLRVTHAWLGGPVEISPGWLGFKITGQTLQMPASVLGAVDARLAAIAPGGDLRASWPPLTFDFRGRLTAPSPLHMDWRQATSALSTVRPLGSYRLTATPDDADGMRLQLKTLQGPLMLEGAGSMTATTTQFDGVARVEPNASSDIRTRLTDLLAAIGPGKNDQTLFSIR
ncbi:MULTISPECIES: type II secretion system protein N [unclassified Bordetella]|uniref:type II secretion system protein N n=1 Tax=unclassified Bordetella TaxID=2630031 RepID=UPI0013222C09|nr:MULTISPECIES: type II secretion system protein N [unclassified Bordetella]MVW72503.1 type II secretion system protein GspN [Bordetella sp. 15P40C-2]MVW79099.1 type II secretion system protein GspN [Bordetella sp. 02P26C-1]